MERVEDTERQLDSLNDDLERIASADDACRRLRQIPGIGPPISTAIVAAIGNGAAFHKGRDFAAWLGLVPKQHSTGGKARLLGISKRGNRYLRKILIHGARAAVLRLKRERAPMGAWMTALEARAPRNVLIVAPQPTNWRGLHGRYYRVAKTIEPRPACLSFERAWKRRLWLKKCHGVSHLPTLRRLIVNLLFEVCIGTVKTKEQSQQRA